MDENTKLQFLKDEYLHLQNKIERFDSKAITIKAWSISFSLATLSGALISHSKSILLLASLSSLMFWIIEGYWKKFQYAYYARLGKIEDYFNGEKTKDLQPLQIGKSWYAKWRKSGKKRLLRIMLWPHVALPHAAIFITGIFLYYIN